MQLDIQFFPTTGDLRRWFAKHSRTATELWIGYHKVASGRPSVTWPESVDEALCAGWIDGIRRSVDDMSYAVRFTPRRPGSNWSEINIRKAQDLIACGKMKPDGLKAFEARKEARSGIYSYERRPEQLPEDYIGKLKANPAAWEYFQAQPPSYRKIVARWIVSAKQEPTRLRRFTQLVGKCSQKRRINLLKPFE